MSGPAPSVIKAGGSILRDESAYRRVAHLLAGRMRTGPTWTVVSAARGVTDTLERLARGGGGADGEGLLRLHSRLACSSADPWFGVELARALAAARAGSPDALLAWGERASVRALRAQLELRGVAAPIVELGSGMLLTGKRSALVPGFYLRGRDGDVRCLPRGGSDISAVLLAIGLGTTTVRFWKEGGGIRSKGRTLAEVSAEKLLARLTDPIRPLHVGALQLARTWGIDLVLEDPFGNSPPTRITSGRRRVRPSRPVPGRTWARSPTDPERRREPRTLSPAGGPVALSGRLRSFP